MGNPKGSQWERRLLQHFREQGFDAERLTLVGKEDEGDLVVKVGEPLIIQAKNEKGFNLAYVKDAKEQATNYAHHRGLFYQPDSFLVLKRRNHQVGQAYVVQELDQWLKGLKA